MGQLALEPDVAALPAVEAADGVGEGVGQHLPQPAEQLSLGRAAELVEVPGSKTQFPTAIETAVGAQINGKLIHRADLKPSEGDAGPTGDPPL